MSDEGKVHIGNLPYRVSEDEIRDTFEKYGNVDEVNIIMDRDTGRAKGFAFVTFQNADDAHDAIEALNDTDFGGRSIKVNKARPRGGGGGGGGGGGRDYNRDRGGSYNRGGGGRSYGDSYSGGGGGGSRYNQQRRY